MGNGPGNGDTLLFAAGQLLGQVVHSLTQSQQLQALLCPGGAVTLVTGQPQGILYVFQSAHHGDQRNGLENEADLRPAQPGTLPLVQTGDLLITEENRSVGGDIQRPQNVQQGGFAGAGTSLQDGQPTFGGLYIDALQRPEVSAAGLKAACDALCFDHVVHSINPLPASVPG